MGRKRTRLRISSMPDLDYLTKQARKKIDNNDFGKVCSREWHKLCKPYIPKQTGALASKVRHLPFETVYDSKYAHYQYTGIVYEDPITHVAGFRGKDGNWYSREGVKKVARTIPTGNRKVQLQYKNPMAIDHWDIMAQSMGKDKELCRILNNYIRNGNL